MIRSPSYGRAHRVRNLNLGVLVSQPFDFGVDVFVRNLDRRLPRFEPVDRDLVDLRSHLDLGLEGERLAFLERRRFVHLGLRDDVELVLLHRLHQALLDQRAGHLSRRLPAVHLLQHIPRHLPWTEAANAGGLADLFIGVVEVLLDAVPRHFDRNLHKDGADLANFRLHGRFRGLTGAVRTAGAESRQGAALGAANSR